MASPSVAAAPGRNSKAAPDSWTYPPDDTWPVKGGEAAEGTSGVVEAVGAGDGTIGYADASQAADLGIIPILVRDACGAGHAEAADQCVASLEHMGDTIVTNLDTISKLLDAIGQS